MIIASKKIRLEEIARERLCEQFAIVDVTNKTASLDLKGHNSVWLCDRE